MKDSMQVNRKSSFIQYLSGLLISISITLVLILLFAILIRYFNIPDNIIFPINQVIKVISLIVGIMFILKKQPQNGLIKGVIVGFLYYVLSFIIFSILQGNIAFNLNNLWDLLLTSLMGGLIGLIAVNLYKN